MRPFLADWRRRMVVIVLLAATVAACGDGDESTPTPSPTPTASATAFPSPTPTPVSSLRDVDFNSPAIARELIARAAGGEIDPARVRFAQLIDGGPEEAVVIVDSGGTAGEIGAGVFRLVEGQPVLVQFFSYNGRLDLNRELIVTRAGVYEAGDADCCPSRLHEVTYQWNGNEFAVTTDQVVPNPSQ